MCAHKRAVLVLLAVLLVTACTGKQHEAGPAVATGDTGMRCPARSTDEWKNAPKGRVDIGQNRTSPVLLTGERPTVHVLPGVTMSGNVQLCGDNATLIVEGRFDGEGLVNGESPKAVFTEASGGSGRVSVGGAGGAVIRCFKDKKNAPERARMCGGLI